ncbi:hypothetical protein [Chryseobacterium daeguense]|uniref:hypothetical protein n=1 Tax=Chryseobacterium daeguense TaxID=412438 RepID=UPI0004223465|nr:hypothetical protein [Chryseobacterium daeguense]
MKRIILKTGLILLTLLVSLFKSQKVKIEGYIKQPESEKIRASIIINDTINKLAKLDSLNFTRRNKIYQEKELVGGNDETGYFKIIAKPTDTLFFNFGRFYHHEKFAVSDLMKQNKIVIEPRSIPCIPQKKCDQKTPSSIYAYVVKKIDVSVVDTSLYCNDESLSLKYKAVYKIEKEFSDHHHDSTIVFTAYDHASMYEYNFKNYENILVYLEEYCGELILSDFFPVYKTENGRWATPIDTYMESHYVSEPPKSINFEKSFCYDLPADASARYLGYKFPKEYYKIENGKAIPIMGRYVEDSIKLWKEFSEKK